jgi:hypothetical protein
MDYFLCYMDGCMHAFGGSEKDQGIAWIWGAKVHVWAYWDTFVFYVPFNLNIVVS